MSKINVIIVVVILWLSYVITTSEKADLDVGDPIIEKLLFSPGGKYFYSQYIRQHQPVLIKKSSLHWPILEQWNNKSFIEQHFSNVTVKPTDNEAGINLLSMINEKVEATFTPTKNSSLLKTIYLPYVLSCNEYLQNILIKLYLHIPMKTEVSFRTKDQLIVALGQPLTLLLFHTEVVINKSTEENFDITKLKNLPHKTVVVETGDQVYIPAYSRYYIQANEEHAESTFISIEFNLFPIQVDETYSYQQVVQTYKDYLNTQTPSLVCNNTLISVKEALTIDFKDDLSVLHLRIPKRNEKPADVMLASGYKMPVLGLGTALLNETTYDAVKYALSIGYRLFDLAHAYPFSEVGFAKALKESEVPREEVFIVTKLATRYLGYQETLNAIELSLTNLETSYIDLYLIHSIECDDFLLTCEEGEPKGTWKESWRAMEKSMLDGKIRSLGVSNFYEAELMELLHWSVQPISVVQNWFDPFNQDIVVRDICSKYNIRYMGFSTLGSRWKLLGLSFNPVMTSELLSIISGHHDYILSHIVLRWAIHNNVTVIPRSGNPNHIAQNFRSLDIKLHQQDIDDINNLRSWADSDDIDDYEV